jgi:hypothetical protein
LAVPHDLLNAIPDPEKQAEQAKQTEQTEQDNNFIRFKDIDSEDKIDIDLDIEIGLF